MRIAQRPLKLGTLGNVAAGDPVPDMLWDQVPRRTRDALLATKRVVDKPLGFTATVPLTITQPGRTCLSCPTPVTGRAKKCAACRGRKG